MLNKILIIEDDANILHSLVAKFRVSGFEVLIDEGVGFIGNLVNTIRISKPDYIILDLILPNIDAFELLNKIKNNDDISVIPVFVFSDMSENDIKTRCHNLGADYFFLKQDLNVDELVIKIKKIIDNRNKLLK